jgi:two-component system, cell cycle response regulator
MNMDDDLDDTTQMRTLKLPAAPAVLLVDDDELVLAQLAVLVTAAGYFVRTAASATEAMKLMEQSPAAIVITDLTMPGIDGLELCQRVRAHAWPSYVYLILLTVRDRERDVLAGLDAGADDYLSKRTSAAHFTARLRVAKRVLELEYSLRTALDEKRQLAMTDPLTGSYNRRYFMRHFGRALKRAQRYGGHVTLLLIDVDHFKRVNDIYGHAIGDAVLQNLTRAVSGCLKRETDWCARLGGEEFAVVLDGTRLADARARAEQLRQAIQRSSIETSAGVVVNITVSIGVSGLVGDFNRKTATVQSLLEQADTNLYASKSGGRNRVTLENPASVRLRSLAPLHNRSNHENAALSVGSVR